MVVVGMGENDGIQGSDLPGKKKGGHDVTTHIEPVVVKAASIDQHDGFPGEFQQSGCALPDIYGGETKKVSFRCVRKELEEDEKQCGDEASGGRITAEVFSSRRGNPPGEKNPRDKKTVVENQSRRSGRYHDEGRKGEGRKTANESKDRFKGPGGKFQKRQGNPGAQGKKACRRQTHGEGDKSDDGDDEEAGQEENR